MPRLHDSASSGNAYKVRLLLTQLGIPFDRIEYDTDHGATRTPKFLSTINANGRVPVLELDDGRCLPESNAILWYLAEGTPYLPGADGPGADGRWLRAQVLQWMFFEQYSHEPNIATVRAWITHGLEMTPERMAALPGKRKGGEAAIAVMEGHLRTCRFFAGERYTIADIALYAYTHVAHEGGFELAPYPAVRAWLKRVAAEPRHLKITD
ncbi:MAG TPA: glutathione S-transferase family protein [Polyangia bacterium]|nr:glutathione S-transferase family protein [Polyangia bacterium]